MIEIDANDQIRILIVEHDEDHAFLEEDILREQLNCETRVVYNRASLKEDDLFFADIVLLENTLPDASGEELLLYIKTKIDVPVIVLTGDEQIHRAVDTLRGGASDFVVKSPRNIALLPKTVSRVLEEYRAQKKIEKEIKEKAALNTKIETLHQILTTLAHYINNSTSTISGYAQLCEQDQFNPRRYEKLVQISIKETKKITLVLKELEKYVNSMDIRTTNYLNVPNAMFAIEEEIKRKMAVIR